MVNQLLTVLLVDDEPLIRRVLLRCLKPEGYKCLEAGSVAEARQILSETPIDLVLCDIHMPEETGLTLLRDSASLPGAPPFLMVTAVDDRVSADTALDLGACGYVIKPFQRRDLRLRVSVALRRGREERLRLNHAHEETLQRLLIASALRDDETGAHVRRLGLYASEIGRLLGWSIERRAQIRLAAAMHDVGKLGIPDAILLKPGRLTPSEWTEMRSHTSLGHKLLSDTGVPLLEMAAQVALRHHERWDGTGYPGRLAGEAIPIEARIVGIVDVYDALSHARPYKAAWEEPEVISYLVQRRGRQFDPELLDLFLANLETMRAIRGSAPESLESVALGMTAPG